VVRAGDSRGESRQVLGFHSYQYTGWNVKFVTDAG
jgi:hypothetical protein